MPVLFPEYSVLLRRPNFGTESEVDAGRTKLGGRPDWIQVDATPRCGASEAEMSFLLQVDSLDEYYMFGDGGMLYLFYCTTCGGTRVLEQSH